MRKVQEGLEMQQVGINERTQMALVGLMWKFRVYPYPDRGPEASSTWSVVPEVHPDKQTLCPGTWTFSFTTELSILSILGMLNLEHTMLVLRP